ncbi:MAG TPA: hypothetical protein VK876_02230 [Rubrivivax sp.]|nr:hypothetical protein [Rubrivivax sp.]
MRHGGFEALLGQPVHLAVVAAEFAFGLAQRGLASQRGHGGHLQVQRGGRSGQAQERRVVALRDLPLRVPVGGRGRRGIGGARCRRRLVHGRRYRRTGIPTLLQEPTQHVDRR